MKIKFLDPTLAALQISPALHFHYRGILFMGTSMNMFQGFFFLLRNCGDRRLSLIYIYIYEQIVSVLYLSEWDSICGDEYEYMNRENRTICFRYSSSCVQGMRD